MQLNNAPITDYEAYERNPKFNWVYSTSKLLSLQNIPWSIFKGDYPCKLPAVSYGYEIDVLSVGSMQTKDYSEEGYIFTKNIQGERSSTYLALSKGEIKWEMQYKEENNVEVPTTTVCGDIKLKINAILSFHFTKYNGLVRFDAIGKDIVSASLAVDPKLANLLPEEWTKKVNRLYNNRPWGK